MNSGKIGYKQMYMVTPSIWELVKKCVNEYEQKLLDNLNKDNTNPTNQSKSHTSQIIHNLSNQDTTLLDSSCPNASQQSSHSETSFSKIPLPPDSFDQTSIPEEPHNSSGKLSLPGGSFNNSRTSFHRSQDRSRSLLNPNNSDTFDRTSIPEKSHNSSGKPPLPGGSFNNSGASFHRSRDRSRSLLNPNNSNSSFLNISRHNFDVSDSFGRLPPPDNFGPEPYVYDPGDYDSFQPRRTSSPIIDDPGDYSSFRPRRTSSPIIDEPQDYDSFRRRRTPSPAGALIPVLPLPSCEKKLPRSPVKTRTRTGALPYHPYTKIPRNDKFICDYCNKHFGRKWNLQKHVNTVHKQKPQILEHPVRRNLKRKEESDFTQPLFKTRKMEEFDKWKV